MLIQLRDEGVSGPKAIVDCFKGGTSASVWIPRQDLEKQSTLKNMYINSYQKAITNKTEKDFEIENSLYQQKIERYNLQFDQFKKVS